MSIGSLHKMQLPSGVQLLSQLRDPHNTHVPKSVILLLLAACVSFWKHFQNSWSWGHLLALKPAGWQLSLTSSTNDQGKNWFCQGIWGPTSSQEEFCWALCKAVIHFLLILIYSACLALLRLCTNLAFVCPPLLCLCPEYKRALGKNSPLGCQTNSISR